MRPSRSSRPKTTWATSRPTCPAAGRLIDHTSNRGEAPMVIDARALLEKMFGYSTAVRSLEPRAGRATAWSRSNTPRRLTVTCWKRLAGT